MFELKVGVNYSGGKDVASPSFARTKFGSRFGLVQYRSARRHMSECRCFVNGSGGTRARTRTFLTLFSAAVLNAALPLKITLTHALSVRSYAFIEAEENLFRVQDFNILDSCISKGIL